VELGATLVEEFLSFGCVPGVGILLGLFPGFFIPLDSLFDSCDVHHDTLLVWLGHHSIVGLEQFGHSQVLFQEIERLVQILFEVVSINGIHIHQARSRTVQQSEERNTVAPASLKILHICVGFAAWLAPFKETSQSKASCRLTQS